MHNYPSDISREQYELIREELEGGTLDRSTLA